MMPPSSSGEPSSIPLRARTSSLLNVPNLLCAMRLAGSPILVGLAVAGQVEVFVALLIFLLLTDWLDGKLAILWKQQTTFGARLDSIADAAMYTALLLGAVRMKWSVVQHELVWLIAVVATYGLSVGWGLVKFRRMPSYHTRSAKTCWLLTSLAAISLFAGWSVWPLRIAGLAVALTNLEAAAITCLLPNWRADVTSAYHAWRDSSNTRRPTA